ncbi:uncharacterized protein G2W53_034441 [Senna tora]|uniref:Uncharacterized protein n=1 Tax=Senna tora TaxID=362788 RepID=A0A834T2L5_9FABA|nr:uncharacterized protein G2W53_034441 [Senna tora]
MEDDKKLVVKKPRFVTAAFGVGFMMLCGFILVAILRVHHDEKRELKHLVEAKEGVLEYCPGSLLGVLHEPYILSLEVVRKS